MSSYWVHDQKGHTAGNIYRRLKTELAVLLSTITEGLEMYRVRLQLMRVICEEKRKGSMEGHRMPEILFLDLSSGFKGGINASPQMEIIFNSTCWL